MIETAFNSNKVKFDKGQIDGVRRIVLVDLDSTLFDSTADWNKAARNALEKLKIKISSDIVMDLYSILYSLSSEFEKLGYQNFRHIWSSYDSYRVLLALVEYLPEKERIIGNLHEGKKIEAEEFLREKGISIKIYYPLVSYLQPAFQYLNYKKRVL